MSDTIEIFQQVIPQVKKIFPEVQFLLRLLLVCPASSAEAERSFNSLRSLITWLQSNMTERRLNSVCVAHSPGVTVDCIDIQGILADFRSRYEVRQKLFGH